MFLVKQGFRVVGRNYLKKYGEIDIIATKGGVYHFIEVKSVTREIISVKSGSKGGRARDSYRAEDSVHKWKLKRLSNTIQVYLSEHRIGDRVDWFCDLVTVVMNKRGDVIEIDYIPHILN
jgi:Holliday junction resolvase-like predicted endonuclease